MTHPADPAARLPLLAPGEEAASTTPVFDAFIASRGKVPNLFRAAAHNAPVVETLHAHMNAVMGKGSVSMLLKELLSVRVSQINACEY
jgi:alkylhydroperoxidase family enzyme